MLSLLSVLILQSSFLHSGNTQSFYNKPQIFLQKHEPALFSCPCQEDLISSVQFLRDDKTEEGNNKLLNDLLKAEIVGKNKVKDNNIIESNSILIVNENHSLELNDTLHNREKDKVIQKKVKKVLTQQNQPEVKQNTSKTKDSRPMFGQTYQNQHNLQNVRTNAVQNIGSNYNCDARNGPVFNIPYQKVSDILYESTFIPEAAYCNDFKMRSNINPKDENIRFNLNKAEAGFNSITCLESQETIAMLFKPKTISLEQIYDNLLKKITVKVLVPYHVSKITL